MVLRLALTGVLAAPLAIGWVQASPGQPAPASAPSEERRDERLRMVNEQVRARGVRDARVLDAMTRVPRHRFVPADQQAVAYADRPLPIGYGQTISQPFIVGFMTEALGVGAADVVLEIGTGSGYQAAILAELAREVYTIEIVPALAARATSTLRALGYTRVHVRTGDGYEGWPEHAPFSKIMLTAAPDAVPPRLVEQLAVGGTMVLPVGPAGGDQELRILTKTASGVITTRSLPVRFVPMVKPPRGRTQPDCGWPFCGHGRETFPGERFETSES